MITVVATNSLKSGFSDAGRSVLELYHIRIFMISLKSDFDVYIQLDPGPEQNYYTCMVIGCLCNLCQTIQH